MFFYLFGCCFIQLLLSTQSLTIWPKFRLTTCQIRTRFVKTTSGIWPILLKMLTSWQYENNHNDLKTLPHVSRRLESACPDLVCSTLIPIQY